MDQEKIGSKSGRNPANILYWAKFPAEIDTFGAESNI